MLRAITDRIAKAQEYLHEIKDVCDRIGVHTNDPPPWMIALPIAYRHIGSRNEETKSIDPRIYDMVGMYLCKRFPELGEYFASKGTIERVRSLQEEVLDVIDEAKRRDRQKDNAPDGTEHRRDTPATPAAQSSYDTKTVDRSSMTTRSTTDSIADQLREEERGFKQDLVRVRELLRNPAMH
ncbi:TPA: hypothetical protein HA251_00095 [Candidatus Woesearchaeota archaeon]|nr:hypothetical protein [Candidatus Woesearchaeota archaeon]